MPLFLIAAVVLFVDLLSKYIIQANVELYQSIPVIENVFHITYILNPGAAFGMLANKTAFFIIVTAAVIISMLVFYKQIKQEGLLFQIALGMVAGGALGNLIDRVRYGKVVDFLDFRIWPIFNMADVAIVTGVGLLIWQILRQGNREEN
jgi:signal peptidase II